MNVLEVVIKPSVVLGVTLALMPLLRTRSAALRHAVLSAAVLCAAAAPLMGLVAPAWSLPVQTARGDAAAEKVSVSEEFSVGSGAIDGGDRSPGTVLEPRSIRVETVLLSVWIAGALAWAAFLLLGLSRLAGLAGAAHRIESGVPLELAGRMGREYGFRRPIILFQAAHPALLVTWGLLQPKVLLPPAARGWSADRLRMVLAHELSHIRRGDWAVLLAAEVARSVYWFNPLFWIAGARLRQESEQACDDAVLARGVSGPDYAAHLVNIARELQPSRVWLPAPAIARTSSLERRVRAMLDTRLNRRPATRSGVIRTSLGLIALTIAIAGFSTAQTPATVSGSIIDPMDAALPGVRVELTNVKDGSRYEARSNGVGRYEFVGVAPGDYDLTATVAGFSKSTVPITLAAGQSVRRDVEMRVGTLEETITVSGKQPPAAPGSNVGKGPSVEEQRAERAAEGCTPAPNRDGTAIGGNLRPPRKLKDVRPIYPADLQTAGVGGTVLLEARIGSDGNVDEVNVVSAPHPDLAASAVEAVRQWQFDSTLLNCVAIDVHMKVSVTFDHQP